MDDMLTLPDHSGALLVAIKELINGIENLDVSIDYLSAAVSGHSPLEIGTDQSLLGRFASPSQRIEENITKKEILNYIMQLRESGRL